MIHKSTRLLLLYENYYPPYFIFPRCNRFSVDIEQNCSAHTDTPEIKNTFRKLHHFRRGNILGAHIQAADDRFVIRNHFLRMPLENCLGMMAPLLWMNKFDTDGNIISMVVPAETLALWDDVSSFFIPLAFLSIS